MWLSCCCRVFWSRVEGPDASVRCRWALRRRWHSACPLASTSTTTWSSWGWRVRRAKVTLRWPSAGCRRGTPPPVTLRRTRCLPCMRGYGVPLGSGLGPLLFILNILNEESLNISGKICHNFENFMLGHTVCYQHAKMLACKHSNYIHVDFNASSKNFWFKWMQTWELSTLC